MDLRNGIMDIKKIIWNINSYFVISQNKIMDILKLWTSKNEIWKSEKKVWGVGGVVVLRTNFLHSTGERYLGSFKQMTCMSTAKIY